MVAGSATGDHGLLHLGLSRAVALKGAMGEDGGIDEEDEDEESTNVQNGVKTTENINGLPRQEQRQRDGNDTTGDENPTFPRVISNCIAFLGIIFIVRCTLH